MGAGLSRLLSSTAATLTQTAQVARSGTHVLTTSVVSVLGRTASDDDEAAAAGGEAGQEAGRSASVVSLEEVTLVGTRGYAPPQITRITSPGQRTVAMDGREAKLIDAFAAGKLLFYMLTGCPPTMSIMQALEAQPPCGCLGGVKIVEPPQLSAPARELMRALQAETVEERMALEDATRHAWLCT